MKLFKNKKNAPKDSKFFIPCYDIINNEIYFSEFFTEEIVTNTEDSLDDNNFLVKQRDENISKKRKEVGTIKLTEEEKKTLIQKKQDKLFLNEFSLRFKKMQIISGFNVNHYVSKIYKDYFSRPLFSHFLHPQNIDLYSSNNTKLINNGISSYSFIDVSIEFHMDSLLGLNLDKYFQDLNEKNNESEGEEYKNEIDYEDSEPNPYYLQLKSDLSEYKQNRKVPLLYIADSLIKDSVKNFEDIMNNIIYKCEENLDTIDEVEIKEMLEDTNTANEGYEIKLIELLTKFKEIKNDKNKAFVLKVIGFEEYLYGENVLGNYNFIINKIRQKEVIRLLLKVIPKYKIHPPNYNFPPIIKVDNKNITYNELFIQYKKLYPENDIVFRLYRTSKRQKERYLKRSNNRTKYLTMFTESGDCDFPLTININNISNIYKFLRWFNNDSYCNNQLILPYFNPLKTIRVAKTNKLGKFFQVIQNSIFSKKEQNNENNKEEDPNEAFKDKLIKKYDNIKKDNKDLEKNINYLKMNSIYQSENYASYITNIFSVGKDNINYNLVIDLLLDKITPPDESSNLQRLPTRRSTNRRINFVPNEEEKLVFFTNNLHNTINNYNNFTSNKYKSFILDNHPEELIKPIFIRVKIYLLYGSYCLQKFKTQPYLLKDLIQMNENITFNDINNHCLISHLPFETRIGIRIKAYDQKLTKGFILGSCQIPLYDDYGEMQKGKINFFIWPNVKIYPRANPQSIFSKKYFDKKKLDQMQKDIEDEKKKLIREKELKYVDIQNKIKLDEDQSKNRRIPSISVDLKRQGSYNIAGDEMGRAKTRNYEKEIDIEQDKLNNFTSITNMVYDNMGKKTQDLWEILQLEKHEELLNSEKEKINIYNERRYSEENNEFNINTKNNDDVIKMDTFFDNISLLNLSSNKIEELTDNHMKEYPYITIKFPKFSAPLIHSITSEKSFRLYLDIKYKHQKIDENNDYKEIRKLFGNSQQEIKYMVNNFESGIKNDFKSSDFYIKNDFKKYNNNTNNLQKEKYPSDIWEYLKKSFSNIVKILKKDPLEKLDQEDITSILICRDYICTIPSALELFLRAIDWRNPLEVSIAYSYLKKWAEIDFFDAVSLLDGRFPDTKVRKYAINILNTFPDSIIELCMPMLCQCLFYENFLINPLADFLIERSLKNQRLIGYQFIYFNRVNMKNPLFEERLSAYSMMFLMMAGNKFVNNLFQEIKINYYLELTQSCYLDKTKEKKKTQKEFFYLKKYFNNNIIKNKKYRIPLDPSFISFKINKFDYSFIEFTSRESGIIPIYNRVILKKDNDYRQENFIVQILRIIDHLWLKNNLDLKLMTYKVFPIELDMGFVEYIYSTNLYNIKNSSGVGGTLDREIIIKHLRCTSSDDSSGSFELTFNEKTDNFIKSLAGYCVVTCVLGVANRVSKNLLIKNNGIFLHIDFYRILGNFKKTFGIKKERTKFLLTPEMANVYIFQQRELEFKKMCVKAFNILRHNASRLINLFFIMSSSGMTGFLGIKEIEYIKEMLVLDTPNDEDAGNYFIEEIRKCKNERLRQLDFFLQNLKL